MNAPQTPTEKAAFEDVQGRLVTMLAFLRETNHDPAIQAAAKHFEERISSQPIISDAKLLERLQLVNTVLGGQGVTDMRMNGVIQNIKDGDFSFMEGTEWDDQDGSLQALQFLGAQWVAEDAASEAVN